MDDSICWLVTILYQNDQLLKCALKVKMDEIPEDCIKYLMETENKKIIHKLLPLHVQECGPIVDIEPLFEICIKGE